MQKIHMKIYTLINKRESVGLKYCNDPKSFIECSNKISDIYKNKIQVQFR